MYRFVPIILLLGALLALPQEASAKVYEKPVSAEQLVRDYGRLVVQITCVGPDGQERLGTGFIMMFRYQASYSYISVLTAAHVIEGATDLVIKTPFRMTFKEIKAVDYAGNADAAEIRAVSYDNPPPNWKSFTTPLAKDSRKVALGSRVFVIGNPQGLSNTISDGLLSGRRVGPSGERLIQITAPISGGSSGGPVLDQRGYLIGIVTAYRQGGQNLNFAVPLEEIQLVPVRAHFLATKIIEEDQASAAAEASRPKATKKRASKSRDRGKAGSHR